MNQLQLRLEVKMAAQQWVASIMQQYGVPAHIMEDALQSVQLSLKDLVMQDLLTETQAEQTPVQEEEEESEDGGAQSDN